MTVPIRIVKNWELTDVDQVIDVRSPREFKSDHIPGALNLYVLSDQQYEIVGRTYKKSPLRLKNGIQLCLGNIRKHLDHTLKINRRIPSSSTAPEEVNAQDHLPLSVPK